MIQDSRPVWPCVCCGGTAVRPYLPGLVQCCTCSHVWADMKVSDEDLRRLYTRGFFEGDAYLDYRAEWPALRRNFRARVAELRRRHPGGGRLWEIGCAYGFFLHEAEPYFDVAGCDVAEEAVRFAREEFHLDARCIDYLARASDTPFDVICMWDTIEHLRQPDEYIRKASRELRPGGTVAIETGDIGSLAARLRGAKWRLIEPPIHLHYFTVRSMRTLLERTGFAEIVIRHIPFWRHMDAVAFRLLASPSHGKSARLYKTLKALRLLDFSFPLQTFDLMVIHARKRPG